MGAGATAGVGSLGTAACCCSIDMIVVVGPRVFVVFAARYLVSIIQE
jgi:hypothetical protein